MAQMSKCATCGTRFQLMAHGEYGWCTTCHEYKSPMRGMSYAKALSTGMPMHRIGDRRWWINGVINWWYADRPDFVWHLVESESPFSPEDTRGDNWETLLQDSIIEA